MTLFDAAKVDVAGRQVNAKVVSNGNIEAAASIPSKGGGAMGAREPVGAKTGGDVRLHIRNGVKVVGGIEEDSVAVEVNGGGIKIDLGVASVEVFNFQTEGQVVLGTEVVAYGETSVPLVGVAMTPRMSEGATNVILLLESHADFGSNVEAPDIGSRFSRNCGLSRLLLPAIVLGIGGHRSEDEGGHNGQDGKDTFHCTNLL